MKKFAAILLCVILVLCLCACSGKQDAAAQPGAEEPTVAETTPQIPATIPKPTPTEETDVFAFAEGTVICGADVSGMTQSDAYAAINQALSEYTLHLRANGRSITLNGSEIGLVCPQSAFDALVDAVESDGDISDIALLTYDSEAVRHILFSSLNVTARNASIHYNSSADCFQISEDSSGKTVDINSILPKLEPVILTLGTELSVTVNEEVVEASIKADSQEAKNALAKANSFLNISLTYSYTPDGKPTQYETLTKDNIGALISFSNDLSSYVSSNALRSYVNQMNTKYSVKGDAGQFKTSGGYYINLTVDYAGQPVDTDGLYDDIRYCLENGISGTRTAPYLDVIECEELAFDGNYVEVNLSAQYLWVYRNGNCVVSTPIVSGCAYYHNTTPTGVYSIYGKSTGVYLVGEGYSSYVNYWMPFLGGYGLHDASWRSSFGGDIYLYDGSHGCVNLPSGVAGSVFNNVSVGTKVILYGGATSAEPVQQNIIGTAEYKIPLGTEPFKLDAEPEYGENKELTYVSSNPAVAEVAADGTVTIKGEGSANITATAAEREYYTSAQLVIKINVYDACKQNGHTFGEWKVTKPATCIAEGSQSRVCSICEHPEDEVIPATGHSFGSWNVTLTPTCTAEGKHQHTCSACGHTEDETVPATGHSFGDWSEVLAPSCTADGKQQHTCGTCGHTEDEVIPATGHSVSTWNTDTEPTCTAPGSKSGVCGSCGATITEEIPMKEHNFSSGGASCDNGCGTANPSYKPPEGEKGDDSTTPDDSGTPTDPA